MDGCAEAPELSGTGDTEAEVAAGERVSGGLDISGDLLLGPTRGAETKTGDSKPSQESRPVFGWKEKASRVGNNDRIVTPRGREAGS